MIRGSEMTHHVESSSLAYVKTREPAMKSATGKTGPDRSPPSAGPGNRCHSYGTYAIYEHVKFQIHAPGGARVRSMGRPAMSAARRISPRLRVSCKPGVTPPWRPGLSAGPGIRLAGGGVFQSASRRGRTMRRSGDGAMASNEASGMGSVRGRVFGISEQFDKIR